MVLSLAQKFLRDVREQDVSFCSLGGVLREFLADYGTYYLILLGVIAIAVMLKAPAGIWGFIVQRYDLQLFPVGRRLVPATSEHPSAS